MRSVWKRFLLTLDMIKFEHSIFALPFAGLFMIGYFYVASRLVGEQLLARRESIVPAEGRGMDVEPSAMARVA